jgi:hypothetical protein
MPELCESLHACIHRRRCVYSIGAESKLYSDLILVKVVDRIESWTTSFYHANTSHWREILFELLL